MVFVNLIFKELVIHGDFKSTVLLKKIEEAAKCNIKRLVLAPAYYDEDSKTTIEEVKKIVEELNSYLKVKNIDLTLYSGNLLRDNYENVKYYIDEILGGITGTNFVLLDVEESNKIDEECLFQLDPGSLKGIHGKKIQKTAKALLKKDIYNFVGFEEKIEETYIDKSIEDLSKKSLFILNPEGARAKRIFKSTKKKKVAIFR